jgi:hypothetical protein
MIKRKLQILQHTKKVEIHDLSKSRHHTWDFWLKSRLNGAVYRESFSKSVPTQSVGHESGTTGEPHSCKFAYSDKPFPWSIAGIQKGPW